MPRPSSSASVPRGRSPAERGDVMRFTRSTTTGTASHLLVGDGDAWHRVDSFEGFDSRTSLSDVLAPSDLAEQVARRTAVVDLTSPEPELADLAHAASIADDDAAIWGAGLNFEGHRQDLDAEPPRRGPGSYLRPPTCLIGNGGHIRLPRQSGRVTAEAELGLVLGTTCSDVDRGDWRSVVAGVTAVLDMTAEDAIRENPRYIPWAKGFDTFCSIGPVLVTLDELDDDLTSIEVSTVRNGTTIATSKTSEMTYDLGFLVEHFSAGRTLRAGTVICTGTPGAAVIEAGDSIRSVVDGVGTLTHAVVR